jgi:hypothetical protein
MTEKREKSHGNTRAAPLLAGTRRILCVLTELTGNYFDIWYDARDFRSALIRGGPEYVKLLKKDLEWKKYRQKLYQLRRSKYIELERVGDSLRLKLTGGGRLTGLTDRIRISGRLPEGEVCLVSFDIPENHRSMRLRMRRFLKRCGFRMRHESLWSSDRDVSLPILQAIKEMGSEKWVQIYRCRKFPD